MSANIAFEIIKIRYKLSHATLIATKKIYWTTRVISHCLSFFFLDDKVFTGPDKVT